MDQDLVNIETIAKDPDLIAIRSLDFIGSVSFSENLGFAVAYSDSCRTEDGSLRGGSRMSGNGDVILVKERRVIWKKNIPRPLHACVSNTGVSAVCDIGFGTELRSNLLVFRPDGSTAVNKVIEANLMSCAITPDGDFVLFNSAGSPTLDDSVKLFAFTLPSGEPAFTVDFLIQELTSAIVDGDHVTVTAEGVTYRYSRAGTLLNKFETEIALFERNMCARYFASAYRILNDCMKDKLQEAQRRRLRTNYERIITSDATPDIKAKARRDVGELCLADGDQLQAITEFRAALTLNANIGLKRKLAELEKRTGTKLPC